MTKITPRLVVSDATRASQFYAEVFGAREIERYATAEGRVVHAGLAIGSSVVALTEEAPEWNSRSPASLGGSPVIFTVELEDPDAVCARAVARGATVVFPIADQFYGRREGRIQDPFGHLWILSKVIEQLSPDEIARRTRAE
jgi:PhnB protein